MWRRDEADCVKCIEHKLVIRTESSGYASNMYLNGVAEYPWCLMCHFIRCSNFLSARSYTDMSHTMHANVEKCTCWAMATTWVRDNNNNYLCPVVRCKCERITWFWFHCVCMSAQWLVVGTMHSTFPRSSLKNVFCMLRNAAPANSFDTYRT